MDVPWDDVRLFLAVVQGKSFSGAARILKLAQPTISRRVADLEALLGEPLFVRGVEGTSLTSFAERLVEPAQRMAESAGELARVAEKSNARPAGVVRITAPPGVAFEFVAPFAKSLRQRLPDIRLEVVSTLQYLDLSRREADLALRMQRPTQRDLLCLAELTTPIAAYASKGYASKLKKGYGFADVDWIGWAPPLDHLSPNRQLAAMIPGFQPVFASDDFIVQLRAAEAGLGAVVLGKVEHRFWERSLVELDLGFAPVTGSLYLVCAKSALAIPRIKAVAELLAAELEHVAPKPARTKRNPAAPR